MEISVTGSASKLYRPDQIVLQLSFEAKDKVYKVALDKGLDQVLSFVNNVLLVEGFLKDNLKTSDFYVSKQEVYDETKKEYVFSNYLFKQNAFLVFPYQKDKLANIISKISELDTPPLYEVNFELSNKDAANDEVLTLAFNDSKRKANIIATINSKKLEECIKVEINDENYYEPRILFSDTNNIDEKVKETYIPRDIEITKSLLSFWKAF